MKIPLFGSTGEDRESDNSQQLTQNLYVHNIATGKSKTTLYSTPRLKLFANIGTGPIRGSRRYNGAYFTVSGNELYEINASGAGVLRGTLSTSGGKVGISDNGPDHGQQLIIVDGKNGYIWNSGTSTFSVIASLDFPSEATHVDFFDGRFIINNPARTGQFAISASYDGTVWDPTEIATAERSPDKLQGLIVSNRQLWLIGTHTAEPWFNAGNLDFPYEPVQSAFSQWGTIAPDSIVEVAGLVFWISQNDEGSGLVLMTSGGNPQVISTPEIASEIQRMSNITDCYSSTYQFQQHSFVVFTFPSGGKTLVYDILTQQWHTWKTESTGYHRSVGNTFVFDKHLVGDPIDGKVYELAFDAGTDNGEPIKRIRRSQSIHGEDRKITHHGVWIDIKEGVGDDASPDPKILLRWKDDNGSWSNYHSRSMGKVGEHDIKCIWRGLGQSYDRVYEISVTDPVNVALIDGFANVEGVKRTKE